MDSKQLSIGTLYALTGTERWSVDPHSISASRIPRVVFQVRTSMSTTRSDCHARFIPEATVHPVGLAFRYWSRFYHLRVPPRSLKQHHHKDDQIHRGAWSWFTQAGALLILTDAMFRWVEVRWQSRHCLLQANELLSLACKITTSALHSPSSMKQRWPQTFASMTTFVQRRKADPRPPSQDLPGHGSTRDGHHAGNPA